MGTALILKKTNGKSNSAAVLFVKKTKKQLELQILYEFAENVYEL